MPPFAGISGLQRLGVLDLSADRCGAGVGRFGGGKGGEQDGGVSSRFASIAIATASSGFSRVVFC